MWVCVMYLRKDNSENSNLATFSMPQGGMPFVKNMSIPFFSFSLDVNGPTIGVVSWIVRVLAV